MKKIFILLASISLIIAFSNNSFSQSQNRELLLEDSLHQFVTNYNLTQRLIDSTSLTSATFAEKELFAQFIDNKYHYIFILDLF